MGVDVDENEELFDRLLFGGSFNSVGPANDVEVFGATAKLINDLVQKFASINQFASPEQTKFTSAELNPEADTLHMLNPAGSQETSPVQSNPLSQRVFAHIEACVLTAIPSLGACFPP